jgi:hypothetical protein
VEDRGAEILGRDRPIFHGAGLAAPALPVAFLLGLTGSKK